MENYRIKKLENGVWVVQIKILLFFWISVYTCNTFREALEIKTEWETVLCR